MKLEQRSQDGRTIILKHGEDKCLSCGVVRGEKQLRWYYYDNPKSKGLYCRDCAIKTEVFVSAEEKYFFWLIDKWEYITIIE